MTTTKTPTPVVIAVDERLKIDHRQAFKQEVLEAMEAGAKAIVLDFSTAGYVDSSGVGVLMTLTRHCRVNGVAFVFAGLSLEQREFFETANLIKLFAIAPDIATALEQIGRSAA